MKANKWTVALLTTGVVSAASVAQAEESALMTALSSTTIGGYVDFSAHWNPGNDTTIPTTGPSGGKDDGFNVNNINLQIAKPMDESQWASGYLVDIVAGQDAVGFNSAGGIGDFTLKQAYVELRAPFGNGIDLKLGTFDTVIGYEVYHGHGNPNYTRSWGWAIEPTQHTGVLASYQVSDIISVSGGVANTLTSGIGTKAHIAGGKSDSQKTWLASVAVTAPEDAGFLAGSTLYGGWVYGFSGAVGGNQANYYVGGSMTTPVEGLSVGFAWDYVDINDDQGGVGTSNYGNVYGLYASFQATEKVSFHARGEYAKGGVIEGLLPAGADDVYSLTGTLQYDLWANVLTRLEVRWDSYDNNVVGGKENPVLVAANAVYSF